MTTYLGEKKLPIPFLMCVSFVNVYEFGCVLLSLLVLKVGYGI